MINQAEVIRDFCIKEKFDFIDCDEDKIKLPCSLDKNYKVDNYTIFIKGFSVGSKKIGLSWGGMKQILNLNTPIDLIEDEWVKERCLPRIFICNKCGKHNLNLKTQDNHKTYDCQSCQKDSQTRSSK
jgi:hypothetical protein